MGSARALKDAGFPLLQLVDMFGSYSVADLEAIGVTLADLKKEGLWAWQLRAAGYTALSLIEAGYPVAELILAGYTSESLPTEQTSDYQDESFYDCWYDSDDDYWSCVDAWFAKESREASRTRNVMKLLRKAK